MALYRYRQIPSGTKQLGRGIKMDWIGNAITLTVNLEVSGEAATQAVTNSIADTIRKIWSASFSDNYTVSSTVSANYRSGDTSADSNRSYIYCTNDHDATNVSPFPTLYYATMNYHFNGKSDLTWTPAHEFGHMLGLGDRYDEGIMSRIADLRGLPRTSSIQPGWGGNIMAETGGVLEKRNIIELFALHACELVTFVEDAATEWWSGMERGIRQSYGVPW